MTQGLSASALSEFSRFLADHIGLHFPVERWPDLERGLGAIARVLGCEDAESCVRHLLSTPLTRERIELLAGELTVGETYFFREKQSLDILSQRILPELARVRHGPERRLRIWSAGCCTGEEPYSIAILLDRFLPEFRHWPVTILGTDINPIFLRKAAEGVFSEWSFRDAPPWLKENYFNPIDSKHFEIAPRIKEKVAFSYLNLAEDIYPSLTTNTTAMDLIFCRNVLMYFNADGTKKVIRHFHGSLIADGWLIVSPTETSCELFTGFSPVQFQGATLYRKGEKTSPAPPMLFPMEAPSLPLPPLSSFVPVPRFSPPLPQSSAGSVGEVEASSYQEALVLFEQRNYLEAAARLKADPAQPPITGEGMALLARSCANLGELSDARAWAEKALAADKLNPELHYLRAIILQEQGTTEEVVFSLKRTLYLAPDFVLAHFALGNLAMRQGNPEEARRYFANVLGLLADYESDDILPQSDGLAAGRLREMIESTQSTERIG